MILIVASGHVTKNNYLSEGLKMITLVHLTVISVWWLGEFS